MIRNRERNIPHFLSELVYRDPAVISRPDIVAIIARTARPSMLITGSKHVWFDLAALALKAHFYDFRLRFLLEFCRHS